MRTTLHAAAVKILALCMLSVAAHAGDLNPPVGPVAPTMKNLQQVEPRTPVETLAGASNAKHVISQPGSYYLTGNLTGESGKHGILVLADNVTIDLNGFTLQGVSGSLDGVGAPPFGGPSTIRNLRVMNGTIASWGGSGAGLGNVLSAVIEDVTARNNGNIGLRVNFGGRIARSRAIDNTQSGISLGNSGGIAIDCVAYSNDGNGFSLADGGSLINCYSSSNGQAGVSVVNAHQSIIGCMIERNTGVGISGGSDMTVQNTTLFANTGGGIRVNFSCRIVGNTITSNGGAGIVGGSISGAGANHIQGNTIIRNSVAIDLTNNPGNLVFGNIINSNTSNTIVNAAASTAPISNNPATASAWANIVTP